MQAAWCWLRRHKLLVRFALIPLLFLAFVVTEHVRGGIMLAHYLRMLRAQGEKVTAGEFMLPPAAGENGAPELLAAAKQLIPGAVLPRFYPSRMRLLPSGNAVVAFRENEWVEDKVTNRWDDLARDLQVNAPTLDAIRKALRKPALDVHLDPSLGPRTPFVHLPVPRSLTQWFGSSIALALHLGRISQAVTDVVSEVSLPRLLARDGIVISELVRIATAAVARTDTWEALQAEPWTDDELAEIQQAWANLEFATNMVRALEGERVFGRSTYDLMRKSNEETAAELFGLQAYLPEDERHEGHVRRNRALAYPQRRCPETLPA